PGRLLERDQVEDRVVRSTPETDDTEQPARATQLEVAPQVLGREATVAPHAEVGEPVLRALADPDDQPALARLLVHDQRVVLHDKVEVAALAVKRGQTLTQVLPQRFLIQGPLAEPEEALGLRGESAGQLI